MSGLSLLNFLYRCTSDCFYYESDETSRSDDDVNYYTPNPGYAASLAKREQEASMPLVRRSSEYQLRRRRVKKKKQDDPEFSSLKEIVVHHGFSGSASPSRPSPLRPPEVVGTLVVETKAHYPQLDADSKVSEDMEKDSVLEEGTGIPTPPPRPKNQKHKEKAQAASASSSSCLDIEPCPYRPSPNRYKTLLRFLSMEGSSDAKRSQDLVWWFKDEMRSFERWKGDRYFYLSAKDLSTCLKYEVFSSIKEWSSVMSLVHPFEWIDFCKNENEQLSHIGIGPEEQRSLLLGVMRIYPENVMRDLFNLEMGETPFYYAHYLANACFNDADLSKAVKENLESPADIKDKEAHVEFVNEFDAIVQKRLQERRKLMDEWDAFQKLSDEKGTEKAKELMKETVVNWHEI